MKTQRFLMALAAIAALSLGSCTQEEKLLVSGNNHDSLNDPNAVLFGTYTGKAPQSRAGVIDADEMKAADFSGFGVYAYYTKQEDFATDETNTKVPDFMCNQLVKWDATASFPGESTKGIWAYSPVKYWPNNAGEKVSFFAYAPYAETAVAEGESGITSLPSNATGGVPKIGYTISQTPGEQIDLLYSEEMLDVNKQNVDQKVLFKFNHAMTRIGFERVIELDEIDKDKDGLHDNQGDANYILDVNSKVTITKVSISSTEFYKSGMLSLSTGSWEALTKEAQTYTLTESDFTNDGMNVTSANSAKKTRLNNEDKYLMIFPTGKETKIPVEVTIEYNVTTDDPSLPNGKSQITSQITTPFEFAFVQGKYYNFVLRIGLTSVKLDVETTGWNTSWNESLSTDTEVTVNTPNNNTVSLIYDANEGIFANGSRQYIVTTHVGNWEKEDGKYDEHNPEEEAQFIVKEFNEGVDIMWVSEDGLANVGPYYFNGWTELPTNHEKQLDSNNTYYDEENGTIFLKRTEKNASRTIYAWWPWADIID